MPSDVSALYPVCCTAEIPTEVLNEFLEESFSGFSEIVPNNPKPKLVLIRTLDDASDTQAASTPPVEPLTNSPFIGKPLTQISEELKTKDNTHNANINPDAFVVLHKMSAQGPRRTCTIVYRDEGKLKSVRATFKMAQRTLVPLQVRSLDMDDVKDEAKEKGNVYDSGDEGAGTAQGAVAKDDDDDDEDSEDEDEDEDEDDDDNEDERTTEDGFVLVDRSGLSAEQGGEETSATRGRGGGRGRGRGRGRGGGRGRGRGRGMGRGRGRGRGEVA